MARNRESNTALHIAALEGQTKILRILLEAKADVDAEGMGNKTALDMTTDKGCRIELLNSGAGKWTPLMVAIENEDTENAKALINRDSVLARNSLQQSALHIAAAAGNLEIISMLIEAKADVHAKDQNGVSALVAIETNTCWREMNLDPWDFFSLLGINRPSFERLRGWPENAVINFENSTVRFNGFSTVRSSLFCSRGQRAYYEIEIISLGECPQIGFCREQFEYHFGFTGQGVGDDSNSWGVDGARVRKWFAGSTKFGSKWRNGDVIGLACDLESLEMLVSVNGAFSAPNGLAFQFPNNLEGVYPSFSDEHGELKFNFGPTFTYRPPENKGFLPFISCSCVTRTVPNNALHRAARSGNTKALRALIQIKADVDTNDDSGKTPLDVACRQDCIDLLMENGADGWSPILLASARGDIERIKILVEECADNILSRNRRLQTALHVAAKNGDDGVIQTLLDLKADVNAKDNEGLTPVALVPRRKVEIRQLLISRGATVPVVQKFRGSPEDMIVNEDVCTVSFERLSTAKSCLYCPRDHKGYYELEILEVGHVYQWGFCTRDWKQTRNFSAVGVGGDEMGWAVDGARTSKWHRGSSQFGSRWKEGDVIGLACDLQNFKMHVSVNGDYSEPDGLAFDLPESLEGLHPAFTSAGGRLKYNFGALPFTFNPPSQDYESFESLRGFSQTDDLHGDEVELSLFFSLFLSPCIVFTFTRHLVTSACPFASSESASGEKTRGGPSSPPPARSTPQNTKMRFVCLLALISRRNFRPNLKGASRT